MDLTPEDIVEFLREAIRLYFVPPTVALQYSSCRNMKKIAIAFIFILFPLGANALEIGFYSAISKSDRSEIAQVFKIEEEADRIIYCDYEKNFDLGLGEIREGSRSPIKFKYPEIKAFLEEEKHKNIVVVWFDKTIMWNKEQFVKNRAQEVTQLMLKVGYKRVVILGGASSGVYYVADTEIDLK